MTAAATALYDLTGISGAALAGIVCAALSALSIIAYNPRAGRSTTVR